MRQRVLGLSLHRGTLSGESLQRRIEAGPSLQGSALGRKWLRQAGYALSLMGYGSQAAR